MAHGFPGWAAQESVKGSAFFHIQGGLAHDIPDIVEVINGPCPPPKNV